MLINEIWNHKIIVSYILYSSFKTQNVGYSMPYVIKLFHYIQPNKHVNPSNVN